MDKFVSILVVGMLSVLVALGLAPAAQAYPEGGQDISVSDQVVFGAQSFRVKATSDVTCKWSIEWNGDTRTKTSKKFTVVFKAPVVSKTTKIPLTGTCVYDTDDLSRVSARAGEAATFEKTIMITVLPAEDDVSAPGDDDDLPATGGPNLWILIAGVASVLGGAVVVRTAKRRGGEA